MRLTIETGALAGQGFDLSSGLVLVGRAGDCELVIPDVGVSGHHAELGIGAGGAVNVRDLGSRNGTWADGERVTGTWSVGEGTQLAFGPVKATLGATTPRKAATGGASRAALVLAALAVLLAGGAVALVATGSLGRSGSGDGGDATAAAARTQARAPGHTATAPRPFTRQDALHLAQQSTVRVVSPGQDWGSGWVMGSDHGHPLVVTNDHVVEGADRLLVNLDGQAQHPASLVGTSQCDDLALLRLDDPASIPALQLGGSPQQGDPLWIAGFPDTGADVIPLQVRSGGVASLHATLDAATRAPAVCRDLVQIDGTVIGGDSGGR